MATIPELLASALQQHQAGNLQQAEQLYRQILQVDFYQMEARDLPDYATAHNNLGAVLQGNRRLGEAEACSREAVRLRPDYAAAHYNLGNILRDQGRLGEAEACFREANRLQPDYAAAHNNLGAVLQDEGRPGE